MLGLERPHLVQRAEHGQLNEVVSVVEVAGGRRLVEQFEVKQQRRRGGGGLWGSAVLGGSA